MADIGKLSVMLTANTKKFDKGMKKSEGIIKRFTKTVKSVKGAVTKTFSAIKGIFKVFYWPIGMTIKLFNKLLGVLRTIFRYASLVGGVLTGIFLAMYDKTRKEIDQVGKLSDVIGLSTEELLGLQFAGLIAGASLKETTRALTIFGRRVGEARIGAGEAAKGFRMLGISAHDLAHMSLYEAFKLVSDRMKQLPTFVDKAGAAFMLFGRQGVQMANALRMGSKELDNWQEVAKMIGFAYSRDKANLVEQMNDRFLTFKGVLKGIWNEILFQTSPVVGAFFSMITEFLIKKNPAKNWVTKALNKIHELTVKLLDNLPSIKAWFLKVAAGALEFSRLMMMAFAPFINLMQVTLQGSKGALMKFAKYQHKKSGNLYDDITRMLVGIKRTGTVPSPYITTAFGAPDYPFYKTPKGTDLAKAFLGGKIGVADLLKEQKGAAAQVLSSKRSMEFLDSASEGFDKVQALINKLQHSYGPWAQETAQKLRVQAAELDAIQKKIDEGEEPGLGQKYNEWIRKAITGAQNRAQKALQDWREEMEAARQAQDRLIRKERESLKPLRDKARLMEKLTQATAKQVRLAYTYLGGGYRVPPTGGPMEDEQERLQKKLRKFALDQALGKNEPVLALGPVTEQLTASNAYLQSIAENTAALTEGGGLDY